MTVWIQISAGQGPAECHWVVARVGEQMSREAIQLGLSFSILEMESGPEKDCWRSLLIRIEGVGHETFAQSWEGTIQWIGRSLFRPNHKRKNWFVGVELLKLPERSASTGKIRFETFRASGPGGQHVNKSETAVRAVHVDSGLTATAQEERSQSANRRLAEARLLQSLKAKQDEAWANAKQKRWQSQYQLERGNPTRTFRGLTFQPL